MTEALPLLTSQTDDGILIATLNRPDKLNALDMGIMDGLTAAVHQFRDTPDLKVMLIRATGRYFSAGADMKGGQRKITPTAHTASGIRENHRLNLNGMQALWDEMEHIEKPIVVAHQGTCVGGGLELSMSCDFRLAGKSASYAFPEGLFGVLPASNGVSRLTRLCGPHWARWMIMANKPVSAERALTMGLVHDVYDDADLDAEALEFCRHLTKQNSEQMGAAKIAIELCAELGRSSARHVERMANSALMLNPAYMEGIAKYIQNIGGKA